MSVRRKDTNIIEYDLDGERGNAHAVMGFVGTILRNLQTPEKEIEETMEMMSSGDYLHLLKVANDAIGGYIRWLTDNDEYFEISK